MKKILHIITSLNDGGAEGVLYRLCTYDKDNTHVVISLVDGGKYKTLLEEKNITVYCLNMPRGKIKLKGLVGCFKYLKKEKPDVVQTWMYHADCIGGIIARLSGAKNIYWNVRNSTLLKGKSKSSTILVAKFCSFLSKFLPKKIIYCAHDAKVIHENLGYSKKIGIVIENGYDLSKYTENETFKSKFRKSIGLINEYFILGMIGRYDPQKDHKNLIRSLALVKKNISNVKLILTGKDLTNDNFLLKKDILESNCENDIILLGQQSDIPYVMNGLDLHILSSSFGEAFPNVLAEAMACKIPCVTTNIGDAAMIVGKTGWVVQPQNPDAIAAVIIKAIKEQQNSPEMWKLRRQAARQQIVDNYSIEKMIMKYHNAWFNI
ncbi:glycosyltransferase [Providencia sp. PROV036]|uniref:glycosyltransferase n=1 Tax=Providencia sp. PROV036 TaxID=2949767 RepID=UPI00234B71E4|nr:glycosyltransferase [Providencia sp. PROV036]